MSEWISVKDRLPVAKEVVLAYESAFDSEWKNGNICTLPRCMKLEEVKNSDGK